MQTGQKENVFFNQWYRIGLFNLLLVATIGLLLRFKMVASLPWVNHKYFLHGHSHFAFSGWISLILMVAILQRIHNYGGIDVIKRCKPLLWVHLTSAYGMLIAFPIFGYAAVSITFSTLSILVSYVYILMVWKNCNETVWGSKTTALSIKAALVFLAISSLGAFWLAALMATHAGTQSLYFSALYFFLHFQYNGWFFFGILGLWLAMLPSDILQKSLGLHKGVMWLVIACLPAVALSGLWMKVPFWIYIIALLSALLQIAALGVSYKDVNKLIGSFVKTLSVAEKWLLSLSAISFLLRIILQSLSTVPALSKFAFAYRPVVIGYLHLILLGCISLFLLAYLYRKNLWKSHTRGAHIGCILFITGIMGTESTLMLQGFGYIGWINIPNTNEVLFGSAVLMFMGIATLFLQSRSNNLLD